MVPRRGRSHQVKRSASSRCSRSRGQGANAATFALNGHALRPSWYVPQLGAVVQLVHPETCADCSVRTVRFALRKGDPPPTDALLAALADRIRSQESTFLWGRVESGGMGPPPELPSRFTWTWQAAAAGSVVPWGLFAVLFAVWCSRQTWTVDTRDWILAGVLFASAAAIRFFVPLAPANWYADFAAPPGGAMYGKGGFYQVSLPPCGGRRNSDLCYQQPARCGRRGPFVSCRQVRDRCLSRGADLWRTHCHTAILRASFRIRCSARACAVLLRCRRCRGCDLGP